MSTQSFDTALDFMPTAKSGGGGGFKSFLTSVLEALRAGRNAEAEYRRQVARGIEPSRAAASAFHVSGAQN